MGASDVLLAVASELSALAKSKLPELREGETVKREWLEGGIYFRETVFAGQTYQARYDFRQRKSHVSGERECIEPLR